MADSNDRPLSPQGYVIGLLPTNQNPFWDEENPPAGQGLPAGGTKGQVLTKKSDTDYDANWADPQGGDGTDTVLYDTGDLGDDWLSYITNDFKEFVSSSYTIVSLGDGSYTTNRKPYDLSAVEIQPGDVLRLYCAFRTSSNTTLPGYIDYIITEVDSDWLHLGYNTIDLPWNFIGTGNYGRALPIFVKPAGDSAIPVIGSTGTEMYIGGGLYGTQTAGATLASSIVITRWQIVRKG